MVGNQILVVDVLDVVCCVHKIIASQGEEGVVCYKNLPHSRYTALEGTEEH